jgi:hypothetical protein
MRDTEEEHLVVAFNNDASERGVRVAVKNLPIQRFPATTSLFGTAQAEMSGGELRLTMPAKSISVFRLY